MKFIMMTKPKAIKVGGNKRKRVVLTLKQKIEICSKIEHSVSKNADEKIQYLANQSMT